MGETKRYEPIEHDEEVQLDDAYAVGEISAEPTEYGIRLRVPHARRSYDEATAQLLIEHKRLAGKVEALQQSLSRYEKVDVAPPSDGSGLVIVDVREHGMRRVYNHGQLTREIPARKCPSNHPFGSYPGKKPAAPKAEPEPDISDPASDEQAAVNAVLAEEEKQEPAVTEGRDLDAEPNEPEPEEKPKPAPKRKAPAKRKPAAKKPAAKAAPAKTEESDNDDWTG